MIGLARMVVLDEASLICDLAEVYHVLDWRSLPPFTAATLAHGLGPDSRIARSISKTPIKTDLILLAAIADALRILVWQNTKDGHKGRNAPKSILGMLLGKEEEKTSAGFDSVDEFRAWHESMTGGDGIG